MKNFGIFMTMALLLGAFGCSEYESSIEYDPTVKFTLTNKSDENGNVGEEVHMWITGESIGPDNKVLVGERRETIYVLENMPAEGEVKTEFEPVTVYAGRNGDVISSKTTEVNNASNIARFEWDGTTLTQY